MTQYKYFYLFLIFTATSILSCNTLDPIPTDRFTDETFWQSFENSELIVNMAYNQMYSADKMWNDEALSDNIYEGRSNTDQRAIRNGIADPSLGRFADEWKQAYEGLKTCHVYLANVDRVPEMDPAVKESRIAEIRFIRAFIYFRLVNFYGDVPFFTKDITLEESYTVSRTPKATILDFIHTELNEISTLLPSRNGRPATENGRITKGAAEAFQARAYLYESNWNKVVEHTENLINEQGTYGAYNLFGTYAGLFAAANEYNQEVILDYGYVPSLKMWGKLYDAAPLSAGARLNAYAPLQSLVDNYITLNGLAIANDASYNDNNPYVNRDPRLAATVVFHGGQWQNFGGNTSTIYIRPGTGSNQTERMDLYVGPSANSTSTGYYVKKYYDVTATQEYQTGLNIIMFRYADILLMYAEAKNELAKLSNEDWDLTVRALRQRAGFTNANALNYPSTASQDQLRTLIRNERRSELALEGLRYYDIIRWKAGSTYLNSEVNGAKFANGNTAYIRLDTRRFDENRDYLWSVPRSQMDINKNLLPNNPGYAN
ncbi:RagB/SusD family nutrient uptake outer membrane protein [Sphingobacterium hungaricum]|uniref:RagB/SusD family nutrient uptake outer membrane protein n=1 Tax=Sphingobacterium hungaricum TaxID=2082723 RepID=A0A928YRZ9_9SPHI|nr:RagB/SusD family nutrient uptake outer membrane protein [Sphingobacterium hungaricum]MBE8713773.1 RagB/SusD family nutrient uptake outer membrane protein [Sphingobacterium hungaricum]